MYYKHFSLNILKTKKNCVSGLLITNHKALYKLNDLWFCSDSNITGLCGIYFFH